MIVHYTQPYLLNPVHLITVHLVGVGGTGSQVLSGLARMNEALISFGHPGLHVHAWDDDFITEANVGRQLFSPADIGQNKASVLITRINRFFGYNWEALPMRFDDSLAANIIISCVDTAATRMEIAKLLSKRKKGGEPHRRYIYWLDFGNSKKTGQVVLGTVFPSEQPKSELTTVKVLPCVTDLFDLSAVNEEDSGPSCSLAEAIRKQDLYINSTLANLGLAILWKLFREGLIHHHGCYLNLETMSVNPIKITEHECSVRVKANDGSGRKNAGVSKRVLRHKGGSGKTGSVGKKQAVRKKV